MRAAALLFAKDLRLLARTPALLAVLVLYPILVAVLVGLALQSDERKPSVALVNLDRSGRTVAVGEERLSIDDYVARLADDVEVKELDPAPAEEALDAGRVAAVLTIPEGFIADLQSGVRQPVIRLATSRRSPFEGDAIARRLEAAVFRLNQRLAVGYVDQVLLLVDLVVDGGQLAILGRSGTALGLRRSRDLVTSLQGELTAQGEGPLAARLDPVVGFIDQTRANLDLARPAANAIRAPIDLRLSEAADGREPFSAFGLAAALLVSLGLAGVLLAAAALSGEREDNALARLARGLVAPWSLVAEKMLFTAAACLVVGMALLGAVALFTSLAVGRWAIWLAALALAGLAFGALGSLAGALARETRTALLAALMLALPLLALGLLPGEPVASAISQVVPFGPAFEVFRALLAEPDLPGGEIAWRLGQLALLAAVFGGAGAVAVRRRSLT